MKIFSEKKNKKKDKSLIFKVLFALFIFFREKISVDGGRHRCLMGKRDPSMLLLKKPWEKMNSGGRGSLGGRGWSPPHCPFLGADESPQAPRPPASSEDLSGEELSTAASSQRSARPPGSDRRCRQAGGPICSILCAKQSGGREPRHETAPTTTRPGVRPLKL